MICKLDRMVMAGSNTDSGSKSEVYCRDDSILYLAFIIRNLFYLKYFNCLFII